MKQTQEVARIGPVGNPAAADNFGNPALAAVGDKHLPLLGHLARDHTEVLLPHRRHCRAHAAMRQRGIEAQFHLQRLIRTVAGIIQQRAGLGNTRGERARIAQRLRPAVESRRHQTLGR